MRRTLALLAALAISTSIKATSLRDFWASRAADDPHLQSAKSMNALEMCLGLAMSETGGPPSVLHGDGEVLMTSLAAGLYGMTKPIYGYRITDRGQYRDVAIGALHAGGWRNEAVKIAQSCS